MDNAIEKFIAAVCDGDSHLVAARKNVSIADLLDWREEADKCQTTAN